MTEILFKDKLQVPTGEMLADVLGKSYRYWTELKDLLVTAHGELTEEWKFYGKKNGWTLKLLRKKRNLFFVKPYNKFFQVTFIFGDKAVSEIMNSDLPDEFKERIKNAVKYAEGRGLNIIVDKKASVEHVLKLAAIKLNN